MNSRLRGLERRIQQIQPSGLIVLCQTADGEREMTAQEFLDAGYTFNDFVRAVKGNSLKDVQAILDTLDTVIE